MREQADDERQTLFDLSDVRVTLNDAQEALRKAMAGDIAERQKFMFKLGFARGTLERVCARHYPAVKPDA